MNNKIANYYSQKELLEQDEGLCSYSFVEHENSVGRFLSVDPLWKKYAWNSNYAFAENMVIDGIDLEGKEWQPVDINKNPVPLNSNNIAGYEWVGYQSFTLKESIFSEEGTEYNTLEELYSANGYVVNPALINANAAIGTVSEAAIKEKQVSFISTTKDKYIPVVVEGARFYSVNSNYQPVEEWSAYLGGQLEFSGIMIPYQNTAGYASGSLNLYSVYANNKVILDYSWSAVSGPAGKGPLSNGVYKVNNYRSRRREHSFVRNGVGFSFDIVPMFQTNRDLLRIHPDSGKFGTEGCIGLTGNASQLRQAEQQIRLYIYSKELELKVNVINNPNHNW